MERLLSLETYTHPSPHTSPLMNLSLVSESFLKSIEAENKTNQPLSQDTFHRLISQSRHSAPVPPPPPPAAARQTAVLAAVKEHNQLLRARLKAPG